MLQLIIKKLIAQSNLSLLSIFFIAFAMMVLLVQKSFSNATEEQEDAKKSTTDMVIGAKGSPLQLVLSNVFHLDQPVGNIPYDKAQKWVKSPMVKAYLPLSIGDNYKSHRILGTSEDYLSYFSLQLAQGESFNATGELVLGSMVAERFQLKLKDTRYSSHGLVETGHTHEDHPLVVTGILEAKDALVDQLIFTSLESVWDAHHHHDEKEITSMLVQFKNPMGALQMPRKINTESNFQAALVNIELAKLKDIIAFPNQLIKYSSWIVLALAILGLVFYFSLFFKKSKLEMTLLITYGYNTYWVFLKSVLEWFILIFVGGGLGLLLSWLAIDLVKPVLENNPSFKLLNLTMPWPYYLKIMVVFHLLIFILQDILFVFFIRKSPAEHLHDEY